MSDPSRAQVMNKVAQILPRVSPEEVMEYLDLYDGPERERVQLAILKLSEGSLDRLQLQVTTAITDYRDVLAWAEFPRETGMHFKQLTNISVEELQGLRDQDRREYLTWLGDDSMVTD